MTARRFASLFLLAAFAFASAPALWAEALTLPQRARQVADRLNPMDSYKLPTGPYEAGRVPVREIEGRVQRQSWRIDGTVDSTLTVMAPLREQVRAAGYDILFECRDLDCGGFDFRFGIEVIPAPDMHVNIRDYRFLSAMRGEDSALSLLVSRIGNSVYIQAVHATSDGQADLRITTGPVTTGTVTTGPGARPDSAGGNGLGAVLVREGHVILSDLEFETGADRLGAGPFASLAELAAFLKANPGYRIALVGHTDSVGSLGGNISLSKRRAEAVRERLTGKYGIDPARVDAEGMGYLAPVASNLTPEGREANRRVEAVILSD